MLYSASGSRFVGNWQRIHCSGKHRHRKTEVFWTVALQSSTKSWYTQSMHYYNVAWGTYLKPNVNGREFDKSEVTGGSFSILLLITVTLNLSPFKDGSLMDTNIEKPLPRVFWGGLKNLTTEMTLWRPSVIFRKSVNSYWRCGSTSEELILIVLTVLPTPPAHPSKRNREDRLINSQPWNKTAQIISSYPY